MILSPFPFAQTRSSKQNISTNKVSLPWQIKFNVQRNWGNISFNTFLKTTPIFMAKKGNGISGNNFLSSTLGEDHYLVSISKQIFGE